jgi:hypothetical protein
MAAKKQEVEQEAADLAPSNYGARNPLPTTSGSSSSGYTGVSEGYLPPAQYQGTVVRRGEADFGIAKIPVPKLSKEKTRVSGVVDSGNKVQPFYDLNTKPGEILASVNDVDRLKMINTLYTRGWYAGSKPEGGLGDNDREAIRRLLYISNLQGVSWDRTLAAMSQAPITSEGSGGRVVQVASTEDLMEVANRTALSTIGRKLSDAEARKFSASYQQAQRGEVYGAESAPSADVFFQNRIQQKYGAETDAYKYLSAVSSVAKILGGL